MRRADCAPADTAATVKCELAGEVLRACGSVRFPAVGWSMLPAVWPGDILVVEHIDREQVSIGDVVVVGRDRKLCGHRVNSIPGDPENPQWTTQGDALPVADRPVRSSELLGRVAYLIRAGKRVAVPARLSGVQRFIALVVRRTLLAGRVLAYLHRIVWRPIAKAASLRPAGQPRRLSPHEHFCELAHRKSGEEESILSCRD